MTTQHSQWNTVGDPVAVIVAWDEAERKYDRVAPNFPRQFFRTDELEARLAQIRDKSYRLYRSEDDAQAKVADLLEAGFHAESWFK